MLFFQKIDHVEAEMRTRKLTCPLSAHRKQLETEYFEKSVKKYLPNWLCKLRKWEENRSQNKNNYISWDTIAAHVQENKTENQ